MGEVPDPGSLDNFWSLGVTQPAVGLGLETVTAGAPGNDPPGVASPFFVGKLAVSVENH